MHIAEHFTSFKMKLQSLWTFQSLLKTLSDFAHIVEPSTSFRIILNEGTKPMDLSESPKYFCDFAYIVKPSTSFKMVLNEVTKLLDLSESPRYFI